MVGLSRRDVERAGCGTDESTGRGLERVAGSSLVDRQIAESADAVAHGHRGRAAEGAAAWVRAENDGHGICLIRGDHVVVNVEHLDRHGGIDGAAGDGVGRLLDKAEVVGLAGRDIETG